MGSPALRESGHVACLSWKPEHTRGFAVAANPIYPISELIVQAGGSIEFEILEDDAELLMAHVGTKHVFYVNDETGIFTAWLSPFERVISTHPNLAPMRNTSTLRGRLEIIDTSTA